MNSNIWLSVVWFKCGLEAGSYLDAVILSVVIVHCCLQIGEYDETIGTCIAFEEHGELYFMDVWYFWRKILGHRNHVIDTLIGYTWITHTSRLSD